MKAVTQERLKSLLEYSPETGIFTWRIDGKRMRIGDPAGCVSRPTGYIVIGIDGGLYLAHRLAWTYVTGTDAPRMDHKDRNRANNAWPNLRPATAKQNMENRSLGRNSSSGVSGVTWIAAKSQWRAQIQHNRKFIHLGYHGDLISAVLARRAAESGLFTHSPLCGGAA